MHVGHQLLGEAGVGEPHQHLVAPVPDRRPAWTPSVLNRQLDLNTLVGHFLAVTYVRVQDFFHPISSLLMTSMATLTSNDEDLVSGPLLSLAP